MSPSFWLLRVESREKERTACKAEQIHKMTTIFTQKVEKNHVTQLATAKNKGTCT